MERLIYTAVSGAELNQTALRISANNLANVNTPGFKADMEYAQAMMVNGSGYHTRYQSQMQPVITDFSQGAVQQTDRNLDLLISRNGFLAVSDASGQEAYTRASSLHVNEQGQLMAGSHPVRNAQGEIELPEFGDISVASDGTLNLLPVGGGAVFQDQRILLVNAENAQMVKGLDGLFRQDNGEQLQQDDEVSVQSGRLEGSNVNAVEEMVNTMMIARQFEMNIRMMRSADQLANTGNKLISGNS